MLDKQLKHLKYVLLYFSSTSIVFGPSSAPESLETLLAASTSVVVGRVVQGTVSGSTVVFSIDTERVLKGSVASGAIIAAKGAISEPTRTRSSELARGIFFLADAGPGSFRLVPPGTGYLLNEMSTFIPLPMTSTPAGQTAAGWGPKERVLLEIMGAIQTEQARPAGGTIDLFSEYQRDPNSALRAVFQTWMRGNSQRLVAIAARALVAEGDIEALSRIERDASLRGTAAARVIFDGLKRYFKNSAPEAISILGRLVSADATENELRVAAAMALARIHTPTALPYLAALLDSPNIDLQTAAVGGFSMFANNVVSGESTPSAGSWRYRTEATIAHSCMDSGAIRANAPYFIGFWKTWWNENSADIAAELPEK
jgi:hypothetical protein